jgi:drug/metabolite transporter (DMT)-like permease
MPAALFGLVAALANAAQSILSKELTTRYPARQLIGPLYALNALLLLPLAPFQAWVWSPTIIALHLASVGLMVATAICVWDLFDAGAASAVTTAGALSPIATAIGVALVIPAAFRPWQAVAAVIVVGGVLFALRDAFGTMGRSASLLRIVGAAAGTGLLTVMARALGDAGVGVVETYVVRTSLAAVVFLVAIPPRAIGLGEVPRLFVRSVVVTVYFVALIIGAQSGSPVTVQTIVATTPLLVLVWESWRTRSLPSRTALMAAVIVSVGVAGVLLT